MEAASLLAAPEIAEVVCRSAALRPAPCLLTARYPLGTADQITGGVFVAYGAHVDEVRNRGPVVTYGMNALDNWGDIDRWIAEAEITSHGPCSIGFVNFGTIHTLRVERIIETFGRGARGFNAYDGVMDTAEFERIVTYADASVGVQISRPSGRA
jgi:hypothetical protein